VSPGLATRVPASGAVSDGHLIIVKIMPSGNTGPDPTGAIHAPPQSIPHFAYFTLHPYDFVSLFSGLLPSIKASIAAAT